MKNIKYVVLIFFVFLSQDFIFSGHHEDIFHEAYQWPTDIPGEMHSEPVVTHRNIVTARPSHDSGDNDFIGEHNILPDKVSFKPGSGESLDLYLKKNDPNPVAPVDSGSVVAENPSAPVDEAGLFPDPTDVGYEHFSREASSLFGSYVPPATVQPHADDPEVAVNADVPASSSDTLSIAKGVLEGLGGKIGGGMNTEEQDKKFLQDQLDDQKVINSMLQRKTPSLATKVMAYIRSKIYSKKKTEAYVSLLKTNIENMNITIKDDYLELAKSNQLSAGHRDKLTPAAKLSIQREIVRAKENIIDYQRALSALGVINDNAVANVATPVQSPSAASVEEPVANPVVSTKESSSDGSALQKDAPKLEPVEPVDLKSVVVTIGRKALLKLKQQNKGKVDFVKNENFMEAQKAVDTELAKIAHKKLDGPEDPSIWAELYAFFHKTVYSKRTIKKTLVDINHEIMTITFEITNQKIMLINDVMRERNKMDPSLKKRKQKYILELQAELVDLGHIAKVLSDAVGEEPDAVSSHPASSDTTVPVEAAPVEPAHDVSESLDGEKSSSEGSSEKSVEVDSVQTNKDAKEDKLDAEGLRARIKSLETKIIDEGVRSTAHIDPFASSLTPDQESVLRKHDALIAGYRTELAELKAQLKKLGT